MCVLQDSSDTGTVIVAAPSSNVATTEQDEELTGGCGNDKDLSLPEGSPPSPKPIQRCTSIDGSGSRTTRRHRERRPNRKKVHSSLDGMFGTAATATKGTARVRSTSTPQAACTAGAETTTTAAAAAEEKNRMVAAAAGSTTTKRELTILGANDVPKVLSSSTHKDRVGKCFAGKNNDSFGSFDSGISDASGCTSEPREELLLRVGKTLRREKRRLLLESVEKQGDVVVGKQSDRGGKLINNNADADARTTADPAKSLREFFFKVSLVGAAAAESFGSGGGETTTTSVATTTTASTTAGNNNRLRRSSGASFEIQD